MVSRIAIIPARGGSKRIPKKNIRKFCGEPIISYALNAALDSNLFDCIHVSTDSESIARVVRELGFKIDFMRSSNLADDHTPIIPVLKYVLEEYQKKGQSFDEVVLIMPCSPLIDSKDLVAAESLMKKFNYSKSILAVAPYTAPIEWAFEYGDNGKLIPQQRGSLSIRSQDLKEKYYDAGVFCFFSTDQVLKCDISGNDLSFVGYKLPKSKAIDIDNDEDWILAEAMYLGVKR